MFWPAKSPDEIQQIVLQALAKNRTYQRGDILGFPGSFLDREVFPASEFLKGMPFLTCLRENPNHIGCHTLAAAETAFTGTQAIEIDLLRLCAEEILAAPPNGYDGYVAPGGTECNIEALWIQRNYARNVLNLAPEQLLVLHSEDTHYSVQKASDLLQIPAQALPVHPTTRAIVKGALHQAVSQAQQKGTRFFVIIANMGTTMFGSVDDLHQIHEELTPTQADYRIHVDAAFGGFIYPFAVEQNPFTFDDPRIASVTMDGHKMLQAPYGTGIFIARKGLMDHVCTAAARYVHGKDYTICGSRSGANAVAVWMILVAYGSEGGKAFIRNLVQRSDQFCQALRQKGIQYFRDPHMNVIAIRAEHATPQTAQRWLLVPDTHEGKPEWWKVVIMDHVNDSALVQLVTELIA